MRSRVRKQKLLPRQAFLVLCEGESEKEYVEMLKRKYRLPITIKTKVSGMAINDRLVKSFVKELDVFGDDDCRVFFVYDGDVPEMVAKLSRLDGTHHQSLF